MSVLFTKSTVLATITQVLLHSGDDMPKNQTFLDNPFLWINSSVQHYTDTFFHFLMRKWNRPLSQVRSKCIAIVASTDILWTFVHNFREPSFFQSICCVLLIFFVIRVILPDLRTWEKKNERKKFQNLDAGVPEYKMEKNYETGRLEPIPFRKYYLTGTKFAARFLWVILLFYVADDFFNVMEESLHPILFRLFIAKTSFTDRTIEILQTTVWLILLYSRFTPYDVPQNKKVHG